MDGEWSDWIALCGLINKFVSSLRERDLMIMNLCSAFSIGIFKCALQASDLWVRSDMSIYRRHWQLLSVH